MISARCIILSIVFSLVAACDDKPPAPTSPLSPLSPLQPPARTPAPSPTATPTPQATQTPTPLPTFTPYLTPTPFPTFEPAEVLRVEAIKGITGFPLARLDAPLGVWPGPWSSDSRHLVVHLPLEPPGDSMGGPMRAALVYDSSTGNFWDTGVREYPIFRAIDWLPDNRLVYATGGGVWMAGADGTDRRLLAACDDIVCQEVSPSPDGERVFVMHRGGYFLIDVAAGEARQVEGVDQGSGGWTWSDDGTQIILVQTSWRYYVIDAVNASATFLVQVPGFGRGGRIGAPSWVAGGHLLLAGELMKSPNNAAVPYVLDPTTGQVTGVSELLNWPDTSSFFARSIARGSYLFVLPPRKSSAPGSGYLYSFETGQLEEMPDVVGTWLPSQGLFAFTWPQDQPQEIHIWQPGGNVIVLSTPGVNSDLFSWSPDGSQIAYVADNAVWIIATDGSSPPVQVTPLLGPPSAPRWSPDNTYLLVPIYHQQEARSFLYLVDLTHK